MTPAPDIRRRDWAMVATLGFIWGANFLVTELALRGVSPSWLAASRISVAALVMMVVWSLRGRVLWRATPRHADWALLAFVGLTATTLPFTLIAWGQQHVTAGFAGVSMASVALIVLPLAHILVPGEFMTWRKTLGMIIGFCGVILLIGVRAFETTDATLEPFGRLACLGGAFCYAVSSIGMRRMGPIDPIGLASVMMIIGAMTAVPLAAFAEGAPHYADAQTVWVVIFLGLVPTAGALLLQIDVVRNAGPVFMSLVNYQVPVWAVALGAWLLSEPLPPSLMIALAFILSGVALSQWGALKRLFST